MACWHQSDWKSTTYQYSIDVFMRISICVIPTISRCMMLQKDFALTDSGPIFESCGHLWFKICGFFSIIAVSLSRNLGHHPIAWMPTSPTPPAHHQRVAQCWGKTSWSPNLGLGWFKRFLSNQPTWWLVSLEKKSVVKTGEWNLYRPKQTSQEGNTEKVVVYLW